MSPVLTKPRHPRVSSREVFHRPFRKVSARVDSPILHPVPWVQGSDPNQDGTPSLLFRRPTLLPYTDIRFLDPVTPSVTATDYDRGGRGETVRKHGGDRLLDDRALKLADPADGMFRPDSDVARVLPTKRESPSLEARQKGLPGTLLGDVDAFDVLETRTWSGPGGRRSRGIGPEGPGVGNGPLDLRRTGPVSAVGRESTGTPRRVGGVCNHPPRVPTHTRVSPSLVQPLVLVLDPEWN